MDGTDILKEEPIWKRERDEVMICPKCGYETSGNFCSNCGFRLQQNRSVTTEKIRQVTDEREDQPEEEIICDAAVPEENGRMEYEISERMDEPYSRLRQRRDDAKERPVKRSRAKKTVKKKTVKKKADKREKKPAERKKDRRREKGEAEATSRRAVGRRRSMDRENGAEYAAGRRTAADAVYRGAARLAVVSSRTMQLISGLLMAFMVCALADAYWSNRKGLGSITTIAEEHNYALALYLAIAGVSLFMGAVWFLWTLTRKAAGGDVRLKRYDTGRGLIPFLIWGAAVFLAGPALHFIPEGLEGLNGIEAGGRAALEAVNSCRNLLLTCSLSGAVLSLIRKILSV
ncbi:zinc ribbon domain-containing protein [Clostridium sp. AM58-1XD]|uniref:zinc ribbon domain-containing protein n=1 Tax=Clostridium sp. AM58-1XD TaxID=2292307 RepID=UPI000E46B14D|nr:zinc ribbon domain-containing protein [Clostridium sp. AM58-1XD]RGY96849.1 zinc ribbon domain-containing protein [Clostridium sp. AM58-1XD]